MSDRVCDVPECTFAQTGVCMRSYPDPGECPDHQAALTRLQGDDRAASENDGRKSGDDGSVPDDQSPQIIGQAVLTAPEDKPSLPRSGTLGLREADALMSSRYVNLIGIVGLPNAGKTACIASLYLLLAHGALNGFSYADSKTLIALEEIARGARRWNDGDAPAEMTVHTELADDRQAGFLHLRLRRNADGRKFDVLVPDLPGEWSSSLISSGDADRFAFLKAAEAVWVLVDGRQFLDSKTRQWAIHRATILLERLAAVLPNPRPKIVLVASWRDKGEFPEEALKEMQNYGEQFGFKIEFAAIASFSTSTDTQPGIGLAELVEGTLDSFLTRPDPWPVTRSSGSGRAFLNFRGH